MVMFNSYISLPDGSLDIRIQHPSKQIPSNISPALWEAPAQEWRWCKTCTIARFQMRHDEASRDTSMKHHDTFE